MKRGGLTINIHLTNRWLYTFISVIVLAAIGVGVYAVTYSSSGAGHSANEIDFSTIAANTIPVSAVNFASPISSMQISSIKGNLSGSVNSSFVASASKNFGGLRAGTLYVGKGTSKVFYVYKPLTALFHALGSQSQPSTATIEMSYLQQDTSWHVVNRISTSGSTISTSAGYWVYSTATLLPGKYKLTVSNTQDAGGWLFLNSVYGQDNNNPATVWNIQ